MDTRTLISRAACLALASMSAAMAADRDRLEDSDFTKTVSIAFNGDSATVTNGAGVSISYGSNTAASPSPPRWRACTTSSPAARRMATCRSPAPVTPRSR